MCVTCESDESPHGQEDNDHVDEDEDRHVVNNADESNKRHEEEDTSDDDHGRANVHDALTAMSAAEQTEHVRVGFIAPAPNRLKLDS